MLIFVLLVNQVNGEVRLNNAEVTQNHWSNILSAFLTPVANSSVIFSFFLENCFQVFVRNFVRNFV